MGVQDVEPDERRVAPGDERVPRHGHHADERGAAGQIEVAPGQPTHHGHRETDDQQR